jgi:hypothetical protein
MERIPNVEDERSPREVIVGEQHSTGGHRVFRVVDQLGGLIGRQRGQQASIRG